MVSKISGCRTCGSYANRKAYLQHLEESFVPIGWTKRIIVQEYLQFFSECKCKLWIKNGCKSEEVTTYLVPNPKNAGGEGGTYV